MRKLVLIGICLVVVAGCGKTSGAAKNGRGKFPGGVASVGIDPQNDPNAAISVQTEQAFEGRPVSAWAEDLNREDVIARDQAGRALSKMGETAYPQLRDGLQSRSEAVRLTSIRSLPQTVMLAHQKETTPIMLGLVRDRSAVVRREAIVRLGWYGKAGDAFLPMLKGIMQSDPDPKVRDAAMVTIESIQQAVTGIIRVNPK